MTPRIKVGEPQPVKCDGCDDFCGYQYSDHMKLHYTTIHDADGSHLGGQYSDYSRILNNGITPYCANCGDRLKFKLIREDSEEL